MTLERIRKTIAPESAKAALRKRHGLPDDAPVEIKTVPMQLISSDGHKFTARITTNTLDRDGEVMNPAGMDASEFDRTGAIFWNHNYDLPVAKPTGKMVRTKGFVDSEAQFATRPTDYQGDFFPDFARAMVQQGIVKGVSIGFISLESRMPSKKDVEDYGDSVRRVHSKFKLLEWSIAPVQCNPDAMIRQAISKGIITESGELVQSAGDSAAVVADAGNDEAKADEVTKTACPDCGAAMDGETCAACTEKPVTEAVEEAIDAADSEKEIELGEVVTHEVPVPMASGENAVVIEEVGAGKSITSDTEEVVCFVDVSQKQQSAPLQAYIIEEIHKRRGRLYA